MANSVYNESSFPAPERRGWVAFVCAGKASEGLPSGGEIWSFVREEHNLLSWGS